MVNGRINYVSITAPILLEEATHQVFLLQGSALGPMPYLVCVRNLVYQFHVFGSRLGHGCGDWNLREIWQWTTEWNLPEDVPKCTRVKIKEQVSQTRKSTTCGQREKTSDLQMVVMGNIKTLAQCRAVVNTVNSALHRLRRTTSRRYLGSCHYLSKLDAVWMHTYSQCRW